MDRNLLQFKMAENNLNMLKIKCRKGIFSEISFQNVIKWKHYSLNELEWMKDFLEDKNQQIASHCLECLAVHGADLNDFKDIIKKRIKDNIYANKVIELAEKQNKPKILLLFMDEENNYINRVILALKRTGNESYMTTLMLSDNEMLLKSIDRLTK